MPLLPALLILLLAPGAPAQGPVEWRELRRGPDRTWEYRIYARRPGGRVEVIERVHCRPDLRDTAGCVEAMGVARLSDLKYKKESITFDAGPAGGQGPLWEINGYVLDCAARAHRHVFREYYGERDELLTRADFRDGAFQPWEGLTEEIGGRVCG